MKRRIEEFARRPAFPLLVVVLISAALSGRWAMALPAALIVLLFDRGLDMAYEAGRRAGRSER